MSDPGNYSPPPSQYTQLCAELRRENDPVKFQALIKEIYRILTEYENAIAN